MTHQETEWEYIILDADPPAHAQGSLCVGDLDGDGNVEVVVGGVGPDGEKTQGAVMWYRPRTLEKGLIAKGGYHVGSAAGDLDGDGKLEVVTGENVDDLSSRRLFLFKMGSSIQEWSRHVVDENPIASAHDVVVADIDGDGRLEIVVNAVYGTVPGVFLYRAPENGDITQPWRRTEIQTGFFEEGLAVADLDADGIMEIVSGESWYHAPAEGPFATPWRRHVFADDFREMCRDITVDVTGTGRDDIVVIESEYSDGKVSWFENRVVEDPTRPWIEHVLDTNIDYGHSLSATRDPQNGEVRIYVGEMSQGGFGAHFNFGARIICYATRDRGKSWETEIICTGQGTHEAIAADVDGDGQIEIVGKDVDLAVVHMWKKRNAGGKQRRIAFRHHFLDWDKPTQSTDIFAADIDGDGRQDVVTGAFWYHNPTWQRRKIPGIYQALCAYDVDGDGRVEVVATKRRRDARSDYEGLTSELVWVKPVDPIAGEWAEHSIGTGSGDWPHGILIGKLLPGGRAALVLGYHSAGSQGHVPEIFEIPNDPSSPWPMRRLSDVAYGEELLATKIAGSSENDIIGGFFWLENLGDGTFRKHQFSDRKISLAGDSDTTYRAPGRIVLADVNSDGRPDLVVGEESLDYPKRKIPRGHLAWVEVPEPQNSRIAEAWKRRVIDKIRCPHSVGAADFDGDGTAELVVGEHDPFLPYRSRSRLFLYSKIDQGGTVWKRELIDGRFEHHDGAKVIELSPGRYGIISIGWNEPRYVHLWEPE